MDKFLTSVLFDLSLDQPMFHQNSLVVIDSTNAFTSINFKWVLPRAG